MNGGPDLELDGTVFRTEGVRKVAQLVRSFILLGAPAAAQLRQQKRCWTPGHPENHRGLIVRVWGWSGHFVQLDQAYQDQILERVSYQKM